VKNIFTIDEITRFSYTTREYEFIVHFPEKVQAIILKRYGGLKPGG